MFSSPRHRAGFTIVECLVALVLLAIGALGAAGVVAAAWRLERAGDDAARAARHLLSVADSLAGTGDCAALVSGMAAGSRDTIRWTATPAPDHVHVQLTTGYPTPLGQRRDTTSLRLPCGAA